MQKQPPRNGLVRVMQGGVEFAERSGNGSAAPGPVLRGHFAVFNQWTEIDSMLEGRFMEAVAPGAFRTAFKQPDRIRVLFQHGRDPEVGDKPIASPDLLREDQEGAYYEAGLFQGIPPLVLDGLRNGQYGASFRFRVLRDRFEDNPGESEHNPNGLPERTIIEAQVPEFGPVTFPAYWGATAGMRSMTDEFVIGGLAQADPELVRSVAEGVDLAAAFRDQQEDIADTFRKRRRHKQRTIPASAVPTSDMRSDPARVLAERADTTDMSLLTSMISLGGRYCECQDDPDETPRKNRMQAVLHELTGLLNEEIDEDEPDDGGPSYFYSADADGEERETPGRRDETEPATEPDPEPEVPPAPDEEPSPEPASDPEKEPEPVGADNGGRSNAAAQGLSPTPLYKPTLTRRGREPWLI